MTYKEKLAQEHPSMIDEECVGGVNGCPHTYGYENYRLCTSDDDIKCAECWNREIPGTEKILSPAEKEEPLDEKIDIHKIIDDAMEKKDRVVTIHISQQFGTTVKVTPYEEEQARWVYNDRCNDRTYDFVCSACGGETDFPSTYCPRCGEPMKMPEEEYSPLAHPETYVSDAIAMINDMTDAQRAEVIKHLEWIRNGCPR